MRKVSFVFLIFVGIFFSLRSHAGPLASLGTQMSFEYDADGRNYEIRQPLSLRGGYRFRHLDLYLEFSRFTQSNQVSYLQIKREHTEWIGWARHIFRNKWIAQPYGALGFGIQYDTVTTNFANDSARDEGTPYSLASLAGGVRFLIAKRLNIDLEGRASVSETYAPNPLLGAGLYAGWSF